MEHFYNGDWQKVKYSTERYNFRNTHPFCLCHRLVLLMLDIFPNYSTTQVSKLLTYLHEHIVLTGTSFKNNIKLLIGSLNQPFMHHMRCPTIQITCRFAQHWVPFQDGSGDGVESWEIVMINFKFAGYSKRHWPLSYQGSACQRIRMTERPFRTDPRSEQQVHEQLICQLCNRVTAMLTSAAFAENSRPLSGGPLGSLDDQQLICCVKKTEKSISIQLPKLNCIKNSS